LKICVGCARRWGSIRSRRGRVTQQLRFVQAGQMLDDEQARSKSFAAHGVVAIDRQGGYARLAINNKILNPALYPFLVSNRNVSL